MGGALEFNNNISYLHFGLLRANICCLREPCDDQSGYWDHVAIKLGAEPLVRIFSGKQKRTRKMQTRNPQVSLARFLWNTKNILGWTSISNHHKDSPRAQNKCSRSFTKHNTFCLNISPVLLETTTKMPNTSLTSVQKMAIFQEGSQRRVASSDFTNYNIGQ